MSRTKLCDTELRVNFAKQMNMLRHDLQFDNLAFRFCRNLVNNNLEPSSNGIIEHFSTILRAENNVVLARVHDILVRFVLRLRRHIDSIRRLSIYWQAGGRLISPGLKPAGLRHIR